MLEGGHLSLVVEIVEGRDGELAAVERDYQAVRFAIGQRFEQNGIYDAEDGGVGADSQGQDNDGERRESGIGEECVGGVAQVLWLGWTARPGWR